MNFETQLQLQAWLDGELPANEARQMAELVARDQEAQSLVAELKMTTTTLAGNEPEVRLPESQDFYWSKIRREVERLEPAGPRDTAAAPDWFLALRHWLVPVAATALVMVLAIGGLHLLQGDGAVKDPYLTEVENLSDHLGSYSFRAPEQKMVVVWVYERTTDADLDPSEIEKAMMQ